MYHSYSSTFVFFKDIRYRIIYHIIVIAKTNNIDIHHIIHHLKKENITRKIVILKTKIYQNTDLLICSQLNIFKEFIINYYFQNKVFL
jgi:hypothetical protein